MASSLLRLFKTPSQIQAETACTWQKLDATITAGSSHTFHFPKLDLEKIKKEAFSDPAFELDLLQCHPMKGFISNSESTLVAAMSVLDARVKSTIHDNKNPLHKHATPFFNFFDAFSRIQGWKNLSQRKESPNSKLGTLYKRGMLLLTHYCYRLWWLVSLQEKAGVPFDGDKTLEILAADTDWMREFKSFYEGFNKVKAAENEFAVTDTLVINMPGNFQQAVPFSREVLEEIRASGLVPSPQTLFPSACECRICKVKVFSLFPWTDLVSLHDDSQHKAGDREKFSNELEAIRSAREKFRAMHHFLFHELENHIGAKFMIQKRNIMLGLSRTVNMRLYSVIPAEIQELAGLMKSHESLTKIDLYESAVDTKGAEVIAAALKNNTTLRVLNLGSNRGIKEQGLQSIATAVQKNHTLEQVTLTYSYDSKSSTETRLVDAIQEKVEQNRKTKPRVRKNWARVALLTAFVRASRDNKIRYSVLPLIPGIIKLGDFEVHPNMLQNIESHDNNMPLIPIINAEGGCCVIA